jgi:hypothetical protein
MTGHEVAAAAELAAAGPGASNWIDAVGFIEICHRSLRLANDDDLVIDVVSGDADRADRHPFDRQAGDQQVSVAVSEFDVAITVPFEFCRVKVQVDEVPLLGTTRGPLVDPGLITCWTPLSRDICSMGPKAKLNEVPTASPETNHTWKPGSGAGGPPFSPVAVKLIFGWQLPEGGLVVEKVTESITIDRPPDWLAAWAAVVVPRTSAAVTTERAAQWRITLT